MEISYARKLNFATPLLFPANEKVSAVRICLDSDHLLPTLRTQTFFVGLHIRSLVTEEEPVPLSDQFELGGAGSVRGYREGDLVGSQVAWTNVEYRFLLEGNSRLFLFADYGYFERKTPEEQQKSLKKISGQKLGYGFGLRISSKAGLLGIDYGLGEGDGVTQGMIHFSMTNRF
jgi:outer membrane protein assembly factor BamA